MRGNINYHYLFFYCVLLCFIVILIEHYVFKSSMFVLPYYNKRMYVCMYHCYFNAHQRYHQRILIHYNRCKLLNQHTKQFVINQLSKMTANKVCIMVI